MPDAPRPQGGRASRQRRHVRVAHVAYAFHRGGLESCIVKLVNRLPPTRFRHDVIALTTLGAMCAEVTRPETGFHAIGKTSGNDPRAALRFLRLVRRLRPDVLVTYTWSVWLEGVLARLLLRVPVLIQSERGEHYYETPPQRRRRLAVQPILAAWTDRIVAVSRHLAHGLCASAISVRRIRVIHNGVDTDRFRAGDPGERRAARALFGASEEEFVVGSVGRLVVEKDYPTLVGAAARLHGRVPLRVVIVGEGPERPALERAIRERRLEQSFVLLGERSDVPLLLRGLDLFTLASVSEGMPNTVLEAMASRVPVVATRVGGVPEIITSGRDGILVEPGDASAFARAFEALYCDREELRRLADAGLARVESAFSIAAMVARYEALFDGLLARRCPGLAAPLPEEVGACAE